MTSLRRPAIAAAICLGVIVVLAAGCANARPATPTAAPGRFVAAQDGRFMLDGQPTTFSGVNFWQAVRCVLFEVKPMSIRQKGSCL